MKKRMLITNRELERLHEISKEYTELTIKFLKANEWNKEHVKMKLLKLKNERDLILTKKQGIWEDVIKNVKSG